MRTEQFQRTFAKVAVTEEMTSARAIPCTFPGCTSSFRHRLGLRIHSTLMGHALPADKLAKGDGPVVEPRVHRGPRTPVEEVPAEAIDIPSVEATALRIALKVLGTHRLTAAAGDDLDPGVLAQALDATIDAALDAFEGGNAPQAQALLMAADTVVDQLLDALGVPDADEDLQPDGTLVDLPDTMG